MDGLNETVSTIFAVYLPARRPLPPRRVRDVAAPALFDIPRRSPTRPARVVVTGLAILVEFVGSVYGGVPMGLERFDVLNGIKLTLLVGALAIVAVAPGPPSSRSGSSRSPPPSASRASTSSTPTACCRACDLSLALNRPARLPELASFSFQSFVFTMSDRIINYTDSVVIGQARRRGHRPYAAFALRPRRLRLRGPRTAPPTSSCRAFSRRRRRGESHIVRDVAHRGASGPHLARRPHRRPDALGPPRPLPSGSSRNEHASVAAQVVARPYRAWCGSRSPSSCRWRTGAARPLF